ncbi:translocation/assembly module TamB domain-containing protein [Parvularcula maris]|uniref:Translocation/assembly module TamB domain-containing protein n=1 Tax=Parvularcula maris TaxID=2965077 RepID=A0A9X2RIL6_9PROT|nr:translocation/assembly module TamB domain-containing protein [Parvularcula maris]MCQ8186195.1 translocation/assembly module TamB domain-containing protein [Parvularcula maris]
MKRFAAISLGTIGVLIGLIVLMLIVLTQVSLPGLGTADPQAGDRSTSRNIGIALVDRISRPIIEDAVREQLGSDISYGEIEGKLPAEIILTDVVLSAGGEVWARADRFVLEWDPLDLISGQVHIETVVLKDGAFLAMPPSVEREEQPEEESSPPSIPDVKLDSLIISDFVLGERILGQRYVFSLESGGRYQDGEIIAELSARTQEGTDRIGLNAFYDEEEVQLSLDLLSEETGLLSTLIKAEDRTELQLEASGELSALTAEIAATAGVYGDLRGSLGGSMDALDRLQATLRWQPGSFLPAEAASALGEEVVLSAVGQLREEVLVVDIERLQAAFGRLGGRIEAGLGEAQSVNAEISGNIEPAVLEPYGAADLGGAFALNADAAAVEDGYAFAAALTAGKVQLTVEDGRSTEEVLFDGRVAATAKGVALDIPQLDPFLAEGASLAGDLRYTAEGMAVGRDLRVQLGTRQGQRVIVTGSGSYATETQGVRANLDLRAGAGALTILSGQEGFQGPLAATVQADGTTERLAVNLGASLPAGQIDGNAFGAGQLNANLTGLPGAPSGNVELSSADGSYEGRAVFAMAGRELSVTEFTLQAGELSGQGTARYNLDTQAAAVDVDLDAGRRTTLVTGQILSGTLEIDARTGEGLNPVDVTAQGRRLRLDDYELGALNLTAQGPRSAIAFDLAATDVGGGGLFITEAASRGTVDAEGDIEIALDTFRAALPGEDQVVSLAAPTRISIGETISVAPTTIDYLEDGVITAEAQIAPRRWTANVEARAIPIPNADATANLDLSLDTDQGTPATFSLAANATGQDETNYSLTADGRWTGEFVQADAQILREGEEVLGTIDAQLPISLQRQPAIGIALEDDGLNVRVRYEDRIAPLLAFAAIEAPPVTGRINADLTVTGGLAAPQAQGRIDLDGARFEDQQVGLTLSELTGGVTFNYTADGTHGEINITGSGANGRDQSVRLTGSVDTRPDSSSVDINLVLDEAQLADSTELELRVTSEINLTGTLSEMLLAGNVRLDELDLTIPELEGGEEVPTYAPVNIVRVDGELDDRAEEIETPQQSGPVINLNLDIGARNGLFVRGRGLQSEWSADLQVRGTADDPRIGGAIRLEDGNLSLGGRTFELTEGLIGFQRSQEINPIIDLQAQTEAGEGINTVTAIINVEGPADDPEISFTSSPRLPEEDVLALILFGRRANDLGAAEALQLAQAGATLSGAFGSGGGMGAGLRSGLGLDRLDIDPSGRALTVGKYISEDIYVSARQSLSEVGTIISVVYEITRSISLETTLQPDGAQTLGANYKRDY